MIECMTRTIRYKTVLVWVALFAVGMGSTFAGGAFAYQNLGSYAAMHMMPSNTISLASNTELSLQQPQMSTTPLSISITPGDVSAAPGSTVKETITTSGVTPAGYDIILYNSAGNVVASTQSNTLTFTYTVPHLSYGNNYNGFAVDVYDASHNMTSKVFYIKSEGP